MKTCTKCGTAKPLDDFYVVKGKRDGRDSRCKECVKAYQRARSRGNPKVQEYDRQRAKLPHRAKLRAKVGKRWREENPDAYRAQTAVNNAVRDGKIRKEPCFFCGSKTRVHAHHHNYSKPLNVTWLCPKCHHRLHAYEDKVSA